jgi:hypothetical protein
MRAWKISNLPEIIDVGKSTIYEAIERGDLLKRYPSSRPIVIESDLDSWLTSLPTENPQTR